MSTKNKGLLEEYRSLREEIMKRIEARLYILSFTIAAVGAILGFALKDGGSIVQRDFFFVVIMMSFALIVIIAALVVTIQYTQQIMTIGSYILHYIEIEPDLGLNYETRLEELRLIKREKRMRENKRFGALNRLRAPLTSSDSLALFYALLTFSVSAIVVFSALFVASSFQLFALSIVLLLVLCSLYCSYYLVVGKGQHKYEGWKADWDEVDKMLKHKANHKTLDAQDELEK